MRASFQAWNTVLLCSSSVVHCVAVCCSVLYWVWSTVLFCVCMFGAVCFTMLQCFAGCSRVLHCVALWLWILSQCAADYSALQCVFCRALQCVAVWCTLLHYVSPTSPACCPATVWVAHQFNLFVILGVEMRSVKMADWCSILILACHSISISNLN